MLCISLSLSFSSQSQNRWSRGGGKRHDTNESGIESRPKVGPAKAKGSCTPTHENADSHHGGQMLPSWYRQIRLIYPRIMVQVLACPILHCLMEKFILITDQSALFVHILLNKTTEPLGGLKKCNTNWCFWRLLSVYLLAPSQKRIAAFT